MSTRQPQDTASTANLAGNPITPSAPPTIVPSTAKNHDNRLSRPAPNRLALYFTNSFAIFFFIGFLRARRLAANQFLAENSHRLPTSDAGWYLYHRAKNYRVVWKAVNSGVKYGFAGGACGLLYGYVEHTWDQRVRHGMVDPGGSMVAGTVTAGVFAVGQRMRRAQVWRCVRVGMGLGLVSGILQDMLRWSHGATPWYVERIQRQKIRLKEKDGKS
jgi:hypothetical protein